MIGGRIYCKTDADNVFGRKGGGKALQKEESLRPMSITVASIAFVIYGFAGFIISAVITVLGLIFGAASSFLADVISSTAVRTTAVSSELIFVAGITYFVVSIMGIISGWWLWGTEKRGAWLGFGPVGVGILTGILFIALGRDLFATELATLFIGISLVLASLMAIGWDSLD